MMDSMEKGEASEIEDSPTAHTSAVLDLTLPSTIQEGAQVESDNSSSGHNTKKRQCIKKAVCILLLIGLGTFIAIDSTTTCYIYDSIIIFLEWIEENPVPGIFSFMIIFLIATVLLIPGFILTLGAGFVFANTFGLGVGVLLGTIATFLGASAGALISFLIGRYLMRDWVSRLSEKYDIFEALDIAFEENGFRIMVLLRLSPAIPFNAINYVAGVTSISFFKYLISLLALIPGTVLYVFLGASAGSLADSASSGGDSTVTTVVIVISVVFGIVAIALTSYYAKKELNKIAENKQQREMEQTEITSDNSGRMNDDDSESMPL